MGQYIVVSAVESQRKKKNQDFQEYLKTSGEHKKMRWILKDLYLSWPRQVQVKK